MKISKEDKNPVGIIKHLIKQYPDDIHQLVNLFESLDNGNGANIENMEDEKIKKLFKSLFKQLGLEKKKTITGEIVYVKISDEICLCEILKKIAKLPEKQQQNLKKTPMTFEEAEKIINQNKEETLLEKHQKNRNIIPTTKNLKLTDEQQHSMMHQSSSNSNLKNFMEKNNLENRFK